MATDTKVEVSKQVIEDHVYNTLQTSKAHAKLIVEEVVNGLVKAIKDSDSVYIHGLGTFKKSVRDARKGRNPRTGEVIDIDASLSVNFAAAKNLKEEVNKKA